VTENDDLAIEVDVQTVATWLESGHDFLLLDVREDDEHAIARIDGAVLVPMSQLGERFPEIAEHRDRHVVVHCHHGGRSMQVTEVLRARGFERAQNMAGGIDRWSVEVDSSVPRY
jgi:rhodanese-related sulfurtransferase